MLQCFISKSIQICYLTYQLRDQISKFLMITIYSAIHLTVTERKSNPYFSHSANERNSFCTLFSLFLHLSALFCHDLNEYAPIAIQQCYRSYRFFSN